MTASPYIGYDPNLNFTLKQSTATTVYIPMINEVSLAYNGTAGTISNTKMTLGSYIFNRFVGTQISMPTASVAIQLIISTNTNFLFNSSVISVYHESPVYVDGDTRFNSSKFSVINGSKIQVSLSASDTQNIGPITIQPFFCFSVATDTANSPTVPSPPTAPTLTLSQLIDTTTLQVGFYNNRLGLQIPSGNISNHKISLSPPTTFWVTADGNPPAGAPGSSSSTLLQGIATDTALTRKLIGNSNKIDSTANTYEVVDDDGITPVATYDLYNKNGDPSSTAVFERKLR
jgi:hypothetical protein